MNNCIISVINCGNPPEINFTLHDIKTTIFNSTGNYKCINGFRPINNIETMTAVCVVDTNDATLGQWLFQDCIGEYSTDILHKIVDLKTLCLELLFIIEAVLSLFYIDRMC